MSRRCSNCFNTIPSWANGVCPVCSRIKKDNRRHRSKHKSAKRKYSFSQSYATRPIKSKAKAENKAKTSSQAKIISKAKKNSKVKKKNDQESNIQGKDEKNPDFDLHVRNHQDVGYVVFDLAIQDDNSELVKLFICHKEIIQEFNREIARGKIRKVINPDAEKNCIKKYLKWKDNVDPGKEFQKTLFYVKLPEISKDGDQDFPNPVFLERMNTYENLLEQKEVDLIKARDEITKSQEIIQKIRLEIAEIQKTKNNHLLSPGIENNFQKLFKYAAFYTSGDSTEFRDLLLSNDLDSNLVLKIASRLEEVLKTNLDISESNQTLGSIINKEETKQIMSEDSIELARLIWKQSVAISLLKTTEKEASSRIILVLFAASILWPKLIK